MAEPSRDLSLSSYPGISLRGRGLRTWRPGGLRLDGRRPPVDLARITEVAPRPRSEVRAQLVDARHARRDVQLHHLVIAERIQVLDQRPEAVSVRRHQNALLSKNVG